MNEQSAVVSTQPISYTFDDDTTDDDDANIRKKGHCSERLSRLVEVTIIFKK
jgi:hypothetical protein